MVRIAFKAVYNLQVFYSNTKLYNILYNANSNNIIIIDFKQAKLFNYKLFKLISLNRKQKYNINQKKQNRNDFAAKLQFSI